MTGATDDDRKGFESRESFRWKGAGRRLAPAAGEDNKVKDKREPTERMPARRVVKLAMFKGAEARRKEVVVMKVEDWMMGVGR